MISVEVEVMRLSKVTLREQIKGGGPRETLWESINILSGSRNCEAEKKARRTIREVGGDLHTPGSQETTKFPPLQRRKFHKD